MDFLSDIVPDDLSATQKAFERILRRRRSLPEGLWGLCELGLNENDYHWLLKWVEGLSPEAALLGLTHWRLVDFDEFEKYRNTVVFGTILLLLEAEHARRFAIEGRIWNSIGGLGWQPETHARLFNYNNQPTMAHKRIIEQAAVKLGLYNAFQSDDGKRWYGTVYFQFGFTKRGFEKRLPEWLAGYGTTLAVEELTKASESFRVMWQGLKNYARRNISESKANEILDASPWVLPTWREILLKRAKDAASRIERTSMDQVGIPSFVTEPVLNWRLGYDPHFESEIVNLDELDLQADKYVIFGGSHQLGLLVRQSSGDYNGADRVKLNPVQQGRHAVRMEDPANGDFAFVQEVTSWDPDDINLYKFDGQIGNRVDDAFNSRIRSGAGFALLLHDYLKVVPDAPQVHLIEKLGLILHGFPNGFSEEVQVQFEEEVWWSSDFFERAATNLPDGAVACTIVESNSLEFRRDLNPVARVRISLSQDVKLRSARCRMIRLEMTDGISQELKLQPSDALRGLPIHITLEYLGNVYRRIVRAPVPYLGMLWENGDEIRAYNPRMMLFTRNARIDSYAIRLPKKMVWKCSIKILGCLRALVSTTE